MKLTRKRLKEVVSYDTKTGVVTWLKATSNYNVNKIGEEVGYIFYLNKIPYRRVSIDGEKYLVHRLIYFYMTGKWPNIVDHNDGNGLNNKWKNIRNTDKAGNAKN